MIDSSNKKLKSIKPYLRFFDFSKLTYKDPIILQNANVFDTLNNMERIVYSTLDHTQKLSQHLIRRDLKETLKNNWEFVHSHISYKEDEKGTEQIRTPLRLVKDRIGDCDCFTTFLSSLLINQGIEHSFRMTKYKGDWQHVYIVVPYKGKEGYYTLDCVLNRFNKEEPFSEKFDKKMNLQVLNGVPNNSIALSGFGDEFEDLNGLGSAETSSPQAIELDYLKRLKTYLINSRDVALQNVADTESQEFVKEIDFLLANFNNAELRENALARLEELENEQNEGLQGFDDEFDFENELEGIEQELLGFDGLDRSFRRSSFRIRHGRPKRPMIRKRLINKLKRKRCVCPNLRGLDALEGLGRRRRRRRRRRFKKFWSKVKKASKKVRKGIKKGFDKFGGTKVGKFVKKVGKALIKYNPLTIAARNGFYLVLRLNLFNTAGKLYYGSLSESEARAKGLNMNEYRNHVKTYNRIRNLIVKKFQGKSSVFDRSLQKGVAKARKKGKLKGLDGLEDITPSTILSGVNELGQLGEPATATAVASASGILATIGAWLKKLNPKKIFDGVKKVSNLIPKRKKEQNVSTLPPNGNMNFSTSSDGNLVERNRPSYGRSNIVDPNPSKKSNMGIWAILGLTMVAGVGAFAMSNSKKKS